MLGMSIEQLILIGLQSQHIIKLLMVKVWVPMLRSGNFCQGYLIYVYPSLSTLLYGMCKLFWNTLKVGWLTMCFRINFYLLLALASASRAIQIQHLDISQMGRLPDQYKFVYTKLHESWRKGKSSPSVSFIAFTEDPHV